MAIDLGAKAEKNFASLCADAGLVATRPDQDRFGWDYLLQDPRDFLVEFDSAKPTLGRALDASPAPIECRCQVKGTRGSKLARSITLSNLLRLTKLQTPVFFCFLHYEVDSDPPKIYLVHLDEPIIERTLRNVRKLHAKGDVGLHRHKLEIRYGATHAVAEPFGPSIRQIVKATIKDGMERYLEWKNRFVSKVGYEAYRYSMTIKTSTNQDELIDLHLGIKDQLEFSSTTVTENRFGIAFPDTAASGGAGVLKIVDHYPETDCCITFRKDDYSSPIEIPAHLYMPPGQVLIDKKDAKFRLVAPGFEIRLRPYRDEMEFMQTLDGESRHPLSVLRSHAQAMELLHDTKGSPCIVELFARGKRLICCEVRLTENSGNWPGLAALVDATLELKQKFGANSELQVSTNQLVRAHAGIFDLLTIVRRGRARVGFQADETFQPDGLVGCASIKQLVLGGLRFTCLFAIVGLAQRDGCAFTVHCDEVKVIKSFVRTAEEPWGENELDALHGIAEAELSIDGVFAIRVP